MDNLKFVKKISVLIIAVTFLSCSTKKDISSQIISKSACPADGNCEIKCLNNNGLIIRNNSKNGLIFEIVENAKTNVFLYTYERKKDENLQDDGYREEVIFEIPSDAKNLKLENEELQTTKIIFGRFCYCKGFTGYYKIDSGTLTIKTSDNISTFNLDFEVKKTPQIVNNISFNKSF